MSLLILSPYAPRDLRDVLVRGLSCFGVYPSAAYCCVKMCPAATKKMRRPSQRVCDGLHNKRRLGVRRWRNMS